MQLYTNYNSWDVELFTSPDRYTGTIAKQVHGAAIISAENCTSGITKADGIIGNLQDNPFGVYTADCMPLILLTKNHALVLHISRHSLLKGILINAAKTLAEEVIDAVHIGPHICEHCFTFSSIEPPLQEFINRYPYAVSRSNELVQISLLQVVMNFLSSIGIDDSAIIQDNRCTFETPNLASYRRWLQEGKFSSFPSMITSVKPAL